MCSLPSIRYASPKKNLAADSDIIDLVTDELSKLLFRLEKNPTKTIGTKHN